MNARQPGWLMMCSSLQRLCIKLPAPPSVLQFDSTVLLIAGVNMKFTVVSTLSMFSVALVVLSSCAVTPEGADPSPQDGECWTMSSAVVEGAVGESTARAALQIWVEAAEGLATDLPASDWVEANSSTDRVRFEGGEQDYAEVTHLPGGWMVLEAGSCGP